MSSPSQSSKSLCVLCHHVGHIGKNCPEKVCILCLASGHVFTECNAITDNVEGEPVEMKEDNVVGVKDLKVEISNNLGPVVKQEIATEPVSRDAENSANVAFNSEESKSREAVIEESKTGYENISREKFRENMIHLFEDQVPEKIIDTFEKDQCGLCKEFFSSEKYAWKHYFSQDHKKQLQTSTQEQKYTYPPFWKIILFALEENATAGKSKNGIFDFLVNKFAELKANMASEDIKEKIRTSLDYMCEFYQNAREKDGIYFMKQRGREELQKIKASKEFEGKFEDSVDKSQSNVRVNNIKDTDIYKERDRIDGKRSNDNDYDRYVQKRQRYEKSGEFKANASFNNRSDGYKESTSRSSRRSNDQRKSGESRDRYNSVNSRKKSEDSRDRYSSRDRQRSSRHEGSVNKGGSSRFPNTNQKRNNDSKSKYSSRSKSKECSRKSAPKVKESTLTPPPEFSVQNLGIIPQSFQPLLQNQSALPQYPNYGQIQSNMGPQIIIMAPENIPSGMLNMLPGMGQIPGMSRIPANYFNAGFSSSMFPTPVSPALTPPSTGRSSELFSPIFRPAGL